MEELVGQFIGRYQITASLGEGGMASVYQAHDSKLDRDVAIKLIGIEDATDVKVARQFEKESRALAKLNHANIIPILDFGKTPEWLYMVMPLIEGGTLKERMGTPLPCAEAAALLAPIAKALAYAHEKSIIHRDVKPSNILIANANTPMLSDFGIAKLLEESETVEMTGTMQAAGTPEYMAPECGLGQPTTFASDIYSLGVVLFELITGQKPFTGDSALAIIHKQAYEDLPKPSGFASQIPGFMNNVLYKALAKDPANRYASMAEFAALLEKIANGETVNVRAARPLGQQKQKPKPLKTALICFSVLVVVGLAFLFFGARLGLKMPALSALLNPAPSQTPTGAFTNTPQPTASLQPTPTNTPSPTVSYPVDIGTPYPQSGQTIEAVNVDKLTLLSQGGYGNPIKVSYSVDGANLYVCTSLGFAIYETESYSRVAFVENSVDFSDCTFSKSTYEMTGLGVDDRLYVWDLLNQSLVTTFNSNEYGMDKNSYSYFEYSPDGKYMMIGDLLWDMESKTFKNRLWLGSSMEFTPDSQQFLVGTDIYAEYRTLENIALTKLLLPENEGFLYSQDGSILMSQKMGEHPEYLGYVNFYNSSDLSLIDSLQFMNMSPYYFYDYWSGGSSYKTVLPAAISQDNHYAAIGSVGDQIQVIDINSGKVTKTFDQGNVNSIDFSYSGDEIAFCSPDTPAVTVLNINTSQRVSLTNFLHACSPVDTPYSYPYQNETYNTTILDGDPSIPVESYGNYIIDPLVFFPDQNNSGLFLSDRNASIGDPLWQQVINSSLLGVKMKYMASPDRNYFATTDGFSVEFFQRVESETNPLQGDAKRMMYYQHDTGSLAFSGDSQYFADVYQNKATVWHLPDLEPVIEINQTKGEFRFSPDSTFVLWITSKGVSIYQTSDGTLLYTNPFGNFFTINPSWTLCVVNKYNILEFYELPSGKLIRSISFDPISIEAMQFTDDGKQLTLISTRGMLYNWGIPE